MKDLGFKPMCCQRFLPRVNKTPSNIMRKRKKSTKEHALSCNVHAYDGSMCSCHVENKVTKEMILTEESIQLARIKKYSIPKKDDQGITNV